jgi:hypothetical protein
MRVGPILIALLCCALPAQAERVTFEYHAVVDVVIPPWDLIASPGAPVYGRFSYDTTTADTDPDATTGWYPGATHEITIGAYHGVSTQSAVRIFDGAFLPPFDAFQLIDFSPGDELPEVGGQPITQFGLSLNGNTSLYSSDALPAAPPSLLDPNLEDPFAYLSVTPGGGGFNATLVSLPEPAGGAGVAGLALALLATRARRA